MRRDEVEDDQRFQARVGAECGSPACSALRGWRLKSRAVPTAVFFFVYRRRWCSCRHVISRREPMFDALGNGQSGVQSRWWAGWKMYTPVSGWALYKMK